MSWRRTATFQLLVRAQLERERGERADDRHQPFVRAAAHAREHEQRGRDERAQHLRAGRGPERGLSPRGQARHDDRAQREAVGELARVQLVQPEHPLVLAHEDVAPGGHPHPRAAGGESAGRDSRRQQ